MSRETSCKTACIGSGSLAYRIVVLLVLAGLLVLVPGGLDYTTNQCGSNTQCRLWIWQSALFGVAVFLLMLSLFARSHSRHPPHDHGGDNSDKDPCFNLHTLSSAALGGVGAGLLFYIATTLLLPHLQVASDQGGKDTLPTYLAVLSIVLTFVTIGIINVAQSTLQRLNEHSAKIADDLQKIRQHSKLIDDLKKQERSQARTDGRLQIQNLALLLIHQNQKQFSVLKPQNPEYHIRATLGLLYTRIWEPQPLLRYLAEHYTAPEAFDLLDEEKDLLCELESFYRDFPDEARREAIDLDWFNQIDRKTRFRDRCNQPAPATT